MSKALQVVEQEQKVFSFLQSQVESQLQQAQTAQLMLQEIRSIRDQVSGVQLHVDRKVDEMTDMVEEVRNSITLTNAECYEIQSAVGTKSFELTKDRFHEEDAEFKEVIGKYRRMIWKHLKRQYNVPKYNCIRRIDFSDALQYIQTFKVEDHI